MPNTSDDPTEVLEVLVGCGCLTIVLIGAILTVAGGVMLLAHWIF